MLTEHNHVEKFLSAISTEENSSISLNEPEKWKSTWLLDDFDSEKWRLKKHESYMDKKTEEWKKVLTIYWNTALPDGNELTSETYRNLLTTIKKIVFLSRQGYEIFSKTHNNHPDTTRSQQQYDLASSLILIVKWLIVQEYRPQLHGFKVICENDIENISCDLLFGKQMADGTFHAIDNFLQEEKNSGKLENHINAGRINYVKVSAALNLRGSETPFIASKRLQLALAKYETRMPPENTDPSYTINRKQYQSARSKHYRDTYGQPISYSSLNTYLQGFKAIGHFSSILPELTGLDWCANINSKNLAHTYGFKPKSRTPTIPIKTALEYLDHAIAWIVHLGKDIVSLKNECDQELLQLMKDKTSRKDHYAKSVNLKISDSLYKKLNDTNIKIVRYNNNPTNYTHAQIRENLSLEEAAECLVAAAFILIGTFSCKRKTEILNLTRNCCRPALDGGWELVFGLRKASPDEKLSLIGRPIPEIVNTAIDILRDLAPSNVIYNHENTEQAPLFLSDYKITKQPKIAVQRSAPSIYKAIELFADIVQVTPNEAGQRWYVRSHELRRFFAISYFWHSKFTNLSALSWFMGHGDIEQTLHYVTEEIANTEMPEEEARYVANLIMEEKDIPSSDFDDLKEKIKKYFGTDNINILNQEDIEDYLLEQFKAGIRVVKHSYNTTTIYTEEHYD